MLRDLCSAFLTTKSNLLGKDAAATLLARHEVKKEKMPDALVEMLTRIASSNQQGELSVHSWRDFKRVCDALVRDPPNTA